MAGKRPSGVALLAVFDGIGGVLTILLTVAALGLFALAGGSTSSALAAKFGPDVSTLLDISAIMLIPIGILAILEAYGLWNGKRWGWWLTIVLTAIGLVFGLMSILAGGVSSIFTVIVAVVIIYYMMQNSTKSYFGV